MTSLRRSQLQGKQFSYTLIEPIGHGSSAQVFKAYRKILGTPFSELVALKLFKSMANSDHLEIELRSLRSVASPFLVPLYSWDVVNGQLAFIFEYVESLSLADLSQTKLPNDEINLILFQIQEGLKDLHAKGLCHGDLSPHNILIDIDGNVKLVDYGLGNVFEKRGTPPFVAPERRQGKIAQISSDLYSLGILLSYLYQNLIPERLAQIHSLWTSINPSVRQWQDIPINPQAQDQLAWRMRKHFGHADGTTQQIDTIAPRLSGADHFRFPYLRCLQPWILLLILLSSLKASSLRFDNLGAVLFFQPNRWFEIHLDGRLLGYTPLSVTNLKPGQHQIRWRHSNASGQFQITLEAGQVVTLSDTQFKER